MSNDLFDAESGNAVVVALDHGIGLGAVPGYRDPAQTVERVLAAEPDGVLLSPRVVQSCRETLEETDTDVIITADYVALSTVPNETGEIIQTQPFDLDRIRRLEPAAVKVMLVFGQRDRQAQTANVEYVTRVAEAFDEIPVVVEAVLWGSQIPERMRNDPEAIESACRIAWELGADMLKIPYPEDQSSLERITHGLSVPVFILGGPSGARSELFDGVQNAIDSGARGVIIGRSVWQAEDPGSVIAELKSIVHGDHHSG